MTRRKRRNHPGGAVALKGERTLAELAEQFDGSRTGRSAWSKAPRMCSAATRPSTEKEVEKLHAIGRLAMENDFLSKVLGRDR